MSTSMATPHEFTIDESATDQPIAVDQFADRLSAFVRGQVELAFRRSAGGRLQLTTLTATSPPPTLDQVLPMLQSLGLRIIDRRSVAVVRDDGLQCHIVVLGVVAGEGDPAITDTVLQRMDDAMSAMWQGRAEIDDVNTLIPRAGLSWREVTVLRAYARYLRQLGRPYSGRFVTQVLQDNIAITAAIVELFLARFGPGADTASPVALERRVVELIDDVPHLESDRMLRALLTVIAATERTNFAADVPGPGRALALKLRPTAIDFAPSPRPMYEIYVHSVEVEGIHLRFGRVARGGLRWSDRSEDLRTEILGLATTQEAKNAVIVPVGAKGGYLARRGHRSPAERAAVGRHCYELFVSAMLDVTDDLDASARHAFGAARGPDAPSTDAYLVVAADKGTATFADVANGIALSRGFWLGDAFASGGGTGYDHKQMGITARGAWTSVQRHLAEIGIDPSRDDFTVVGIGDMSGDVFGNGMLLSPHICLVAAFDHRDIFLDPTPSAAVAHAERRRLFALPGSSWQDYDRGRISAGGGVWSRSAKTIPLSAPVREALGLADDVDVLTPADLISAILCAPVNLIWNGGVGTYVKASHQGDLDVGDKANDAVRVDANRLRADIVVEGGNLGLTQAARIEFARNGGRVNTDALDNSAGVDCSDHEVNIKIAVDRLRAVGAVRLGERETLLRSFEDEVAELVLANNRDHNDVLGVSRRTAPALNDVYARLVADLEARGRLDRHRVALPDAAEFAEMTEKGRGLLSPDLATLMAYTKLAVKQDLLDDPAFDPADFDDCFVQYFPRRLREMIVDRGVAHPLHAEIVATELVNHLVAVCGFSFVHRLREETGAGTIDVVRAFRLTNELFGLDRLRADLSTGDLPVDTADEIRLRIRLLADTCAAWFIDHRRLDIETERRRLSPALDEIATVLAARGPRSQPDPAAGIATNTSGPPLPDAVGVKLRMTEYGSDILDVADIAVSRRRDVRIVARVFLAVRERLRLTALDDTVSRIVMTGGRTHFLARLALRSQLAAATRDLTEALLDDEVAADASAPVDRLAAHQPLLADIDDLIETVVTASNPDLEALVVLVHRLSALSRAVGAASAAHAS